MTEGKGTIYFAPGDGNIPRNLSFPLINETNFTLLKTGKPGLLEGPRRVLRLCLFALVIPSVLITIPLYVRLVLYPPGHYPMMPTDQRILNRHVSGVWCQAQTTHMNGSFNAFLSHGSPGVGRDRRRHVMLHTMKMKDDVKEYWGFHFLKGSTITISSCARWDGGQLMILRGIENLRRCAWIGEQDSFEDMAEDDDIISEERARLRDQLMKEALKKKKKTPSRNEVPELPNNNDHQSQERRKSIAQLLREAIKMSKDKKEILKILHSEGKHHKYIIHGQLINKDSNVENDTDNKSVNRDFLVENGTDNKSINKDFHVENDTDNKSLSKDTNRTDKSLLDVVDGNKTESQTTSVYTRIDPGGLTNGPLRASLSRRLKDETRRSKRKRLRENRRKKKKGGRRRVENLTVEDLPQHKKGGAARLKRFAEDESADGAFEDLDTGDVIDILMDPKKKEKELNVSSLEMIVGGQVFYPEGLKFERGRFNQTTMYDNSREEEVSSYSSSEEALASCEGVILNLPLVSYRGCNFKSVSLNKITYDIPVTGTYYFVFSSDNEIFENDMFFNLTMDRVVYNTDSSEQVCSNATDCSVPLSFWSDDQAVVEVPEVGHWDNAYVLDTKCEPRVYVYLTLLLLVPLFIMCCAFH